MLILGPPGAQKLSRGGVSPLRSFLINALALGTCSGSVFGFVRSWVNTLCYQGGMELLLRTDSTTASDDGSWLRPQLSTDTGHTCMHPHIHPLRRQHHSVSASTRTVLWPRCSACHVSHAVLHEVPAILLMPRTINLQHWTRRVFVPTAVHPSAPSCAC